MQNSAQDTRITDSTRPDGPINPITPGSSDLMGELGPEAASRRTSGIKSSIPGVAARRKFRFHMKFVESDRGRRMIEGYASTRDLDRTGDIVQPNAFAESLKDYLTNPVVTYMHDWSNPIGKVIDARLDELGLFIRAEISETAGTVWKLIEEGILRAFSIGYEVVEEKVVDGVNHILKLRLYEVAVVSIPANRRALFSVSKAVEAGSDLVEYFPEGGSQIGHEQRQALETTVRAARADQGLVEIKEILKEVMEKLGRGRCAQDAW